MPGPNRTPTNIVHMTGNPGKRAINHHEPKPRGKAECPQWLNARERKVWRRHAAELHRLELLTSIDRETFAAYCVLAGEIERVVGELHRLEREQAELAAAIASGSLFNEWGGRRGFDRRIVELGWIKSQDGCDEAGVLARAAAAQELYRLEQIERRVREVEAAGANGGGLVTVTDKGNVIQHPLVGIRNQLLKQMATFGDRFGMSPAARTRISVTQDPAQGNLFAGYEDVDRPEPARGAI